MSKDAGIDLGWSELQTAVADSVAHYCRDRCSDDGVRAAFQSFPADLWKGLADLGVLALGSSDALQAGDGGPLEVCAAAESLGRGLFPGPIAATFAAMGILPNDIRATVAGGDAIVSLSAAASPGRARGPVPWAAAAQVFLVVANNRIHIGAPTGEVSTVETVGGEPWGRVVLELGDDLGAAARPVAVNDMVVASYLAAAGGRLVEITCEHVSTRKQFGRTLGEFQAVAHPLADASMRLGAAGSLARAAACKLADPGANLEDVVVAATGARMSAAAASLDAAGVCHQAFGALGVTTEGPVFPFTRRIRQLASTPPTPDGRRDLLVEHFGAAAENR